MVKRCTGCCRRGAIRVRWTRSAEFAGEVSDRLTGSAGDQEDSGHVDNSLDVDQMRSSEQGPRIVAIGGGTGVSTLLRGLKHRTGNLTAIVTVADDGGSSGRLREDLRMPPPGDARSCLVALSEAGPLMDELLDYRFNDSSDLRGHSVGNLLLAALHEKYGGFQEGLEAGALLLGVSGRVLPVSNRADLVLMAQTSSGAVLRGESQVGLASEPIQRIWLEPDGARACEAAINAIQQADLIVIGPGSLYTSILPNFLLHEIGEAVAASIAPTVLVCNVATQLHETDGFDASDHLAAFQAHSGVYVSHFLVNSKVRQVHGELHQTAVPPASKVDGFHGVLVSADVVNDEMPVRHDPHRLADALMNILRDDPANRRASRAADWVCPVSAGREG